MRASYQPPFAWLSWTISMLSVKTRPKPGSTSLATRSFSEVGLDAGWMSNFMLMSLAPAAGGGAVLAPAYPGSGPAGLLGFWPDHRQPCYGRFPWPAYRRGHAFAEGGSPVCFAEMPLDNR